MSRPRALPVALLVLMATLAACGGGDDQPDAVSWRNVALDLPDDWYLVEETDDRLSIASEPLQVGGDGDGEEGTPPDGDVVGMFFTYEPGTGPDDWRRFVDQQDATLETDDRLELDGEVPATRLVYSYTTGGVPTREMVVVIPSRSIVVIAMPIPGPGDDDAPEVFLEHIETFLQVLETAEFGAPVEG
jgi:hypothetical protein